MLLAAGPSIERLGPFGFAQGRLARKRPSLHKHGRPHTVSHYLCYIMPTGGAGSLGSPALDKGILSMMPASPAITTNPTR
jgi:hypothetical protein